MITLSLGFAFPIMNACVYRKMKQEIVLTECTMGIPDTVSFSRDVAPLLAANCATQGCHTGTSPEGNLNLEASFAYAQITRKSKGYLDTLNPKRSVLYNSLTSPDNLMPPSGKMEDCKIDLIMKWMAQRAENN